MSGDSQGTVFQGNLNKLCISLADNKLKQAIKHISIANNYNKEKPMNSINFDSK